MRRIPYLLSRHGWQTVFGPSGNAGYHGKVSLKAACWKMVLFKKIPEREV